MNQGWSQCTCTLTVLSLKRNRGPYWSKGAYWNEGAYSIGALSRKGALFKQNEFEGGALFGTRVLNWIITDSYLLIAPPKQHYSFPRNMPPLFITKLASWLKNASEDDQEKVDKKIMVHSYKFHIVIQSVLVVLVTYFLNAFFFFFFFFRSTFGWRWATAYPFTWNDFKVLRR